jgi:hypothetical protein
VTDRVNGVRFGRKSDQAASKLGAALRRAAVDQEFDDAQRMPRGRRVDDEPDCDAPDEPPPGWGRS